MIDRACDDPNHCVTCSDEGIPMAVESIHDNGAIATCIGTAGDRCDVMTALVDPVSIGDTLLVHAAVALVNLGKSR